MSPTFLHLSRFGALVVAALFATSAGAQEQLAIKGGRILPIANPPIEGGVILIRDGKIQAVGKDLAIPTDYRVIDATGKVVLPGFIEAHSSRGMDQANERNSNVPFLSVVDAIDPGQEYFEDCRRNGVTTVAIVPGEDTMIGGQAAIIKTAGTYVEQMIVKRQAGLKISLRPATGRSRMSHMASLRKELDAARDALQDERDRARVTSGERKPDTPRAAQNGDQAGDPTQPDPQTGDNPDAAPGATPDTAVRREALVRLLKGQMPAFLYCDAAMDVPQAVRLTQEYKLKTVLVLSHNCYKAAKQVAESKLPVILDPTLVFWETDPRTGEDHKIILPKIYREAGVPMTFQVTGLAAGNLARGPDLPPPLGTNFLWYQAATAVKYGTPLPEALEALTLRPAKLLGAEALAGSIETGKDADLVILTGEPLKLTTWVETTLVRGKVVYERDKDRKLQHLLPAPQEKVTSPMNTTRKLACLVLALAAAPALAGPPHAYRAARIWPGDGPAIANGVLIVRDGKVVAVGPRDRVNLPEDAQVHDLGPAVLIPGLVIAETTLGERGRDDERALTPECRALDGFDFYADYGQALSGGVTTVQIAPGSRRLMPGQGAVVKLAGPDPAARTLRERESLRILLGDAFKDPPRIFEPPVAAVSVDRPLEPTRQQLAASLGSAVAGLRATLRAARDYGKQSPGRKDKDVQLAAVSEHLGNGGRVRVTTPGAADIRAALGLAREFDLRLLLVDPAGLEPFRDQLAGWRETVAGVVLSAEVRPGAVADLPAADKDAPKRQSPPQKARELLAAGLKVAVRPVADNDLGDTLFVAGLFTAGGLSTQDVLRMLTTAPADLLGVGERVGSLAAGKDADFVVLDGEPFGTHTRVLATYVNGDAAFASKSAPKATVIQAGRVYTGTGEVIAHGSVLVEGGTVRGVGRDVSTPPDAVIRRYDRAVVVPGFLDLSTGLGLGGPLTTAVSLQTNLGDRLVSQDPAMAVARQGGVTTVLLATTSPGPSPVIAFKLGDRPRVVQEPVAIRFGITGNLTAQATTLRSALQPGKAYADGWARYETALAEYEKKKQEYDAAKAKAAPPTKPAEGGKPDAAKKDEPKPPEAPTKPQVFDALEPYRALFSSKIPALVEAHRIDAIKLAVQVFRDEFKVRTVLLGADDAFRVADLLAEKQVAVAVGPELVRTVEHESVNTAQVLANRGIPFGFQSKATTGVKTLPTAVQYAVRRGLGADDALAGLTAAPAKLLSIDKQLGTLAVGRDADLVVLSGPPFELSTRVLAVMIDGQWVYEEKEEDR